MVMKELIKDIRTDTSKALTDWSDLDLLKTRAVLWLGAILVGVVSAAFAVSCHWASSVNASWYQDNPYLPYIFLPFGLLFLHVLTNWINPMSVGSGIPQVIAAAKASQSALLSWQLAITKFVMTVLGHLLGASIGREGPTVHISSSILCSFAKYAKINKRDIEQGIIVAGGAAGLSAAFNTPLAGIVFAIEELSRKFEERMSYLTLITVVIAALVSMSLFGNHSYFGTFDITMSWNQASYVAVVVGIICGVLGGLFSKLLLYIKSQTQKFSFNQNVFLALFCGLVIAVLGHMTNGFVFGTGYRQTIDILAGNMQEGSFFLPIAKMMATLASYMSGIPGGIFAPSLATGASIGHYLSVYLDVVGPVAATLGMAAYLAGTVGAPITSFVIVAELVRDQSMIIPLMIATIIASVASKSVCPQLLYHRLSLNYIDHLEKLRKNQDDK